MNLLESFFLGILQGVTEFLPISSTGHLIIARQVLHINIQESLPFDVFLHLATIAAIFIYFRKDIIRLILSTLRLITFRLVSVEEKTLVSSIIVGTLPAAVIGFLLETSIESTFRNLFLVAIALIGGSILFWYADKKATGDKTLTPRKGFIIGFFQALALIPGISRSGATISGALIEGLPREKSIRFSFLLGFPIILLAGMYNVFKYSEVLFTAPELLPSLIGFAAALISGLVAIHFLVRFLSRHSFRVFIIYRLALAFLILWLFF